jgi:hypothetical protein
VRGGASSPEQSRARRALETSPVESKREKGASVLMEEEFFCVYFESGKN